MGLGVRRETRQDLKSISEAWDEVTRADLPLRTCRDLWLGDVSPPLPIAPCPWRSLSSAQLVSASVFLLFILSLFLYHPSFRVVLLLLISSLLASHISPRLSDSLSVSLPLAVYPCSWCFLQVSMCPCSYLSGSLIISLGPVFVS